MVAHVFVGLRHVYVTVGVWNKVFWKVDCFPVTRSPASRVLISWSAILRDALEFMLPINIPQCIVH